MNLMHLVFWAVIIIGAAVFIFYIIPENQDAKDIDATLSVSTGCIELLCFPGNITLEANVENKRFNIKRIHIESSDPKIRLAERDFYVDIPLNSSEDLSIPIRYDGYGESSGKFVFDVTYYGSESDEQFKSKLETQEEYTLRKPNLWIDVYDPLLPSHSDYSNFLSIHNEEKFSVDNLKIVICTCNENSVSGTVGDSNIVSKGKDGEGCTADPLINAYVAEDFHRDPIDEDTEAAISLNRGEDHSGCEVKAYLFWRPAKKDEYILLDDDWATIYLNK